MLDYVVPVYKKNYVDNSMCLLENMESCMLEKMVVEYSQKQASRAQRKLVVFNLPEVQEKIDQVGVEADE